MGISSQQFKQMQGRLGRTSRVAAPIFERQPPSGLSLQTVILGLDPSLRGTGYGGTIAVSSAPGQGSRFDVRWPEA